MDLTNHRFRKGTGAAQISLPFLAHTRSQVACASPTMLDFSGSGNAKPFLDPFMGLHLGHGKSLKKLGKGSIPNGRFLRKGDLNSVGG
jgi:hypothetical protein